AGPPGGDQGRSDYCRGRVITLRSGWQQGVDLAAVESDIFPAHTGGPISAMGAGRRRCDEKSGCDPLELAHDVKPDRATPDLKPVYGLISGNARRVLSDKGATNPEEECHEDNRSRRFDPYRWVRRRVGCQRGAGRKARRRVIREYLFRGGAAAAAPRRRVAALVLVERGRQGVPRGSGRGSELR